MAVRTETLVRVGSLCKRGHEWEESGGSLRYVRKSGRLATCVTCHIERQNARFLANKEKCLNQSKEYRQANKERLKEYYQDYYLKNSERIKARMRQYGKDNREKISEQKREYNARNRDAYLEYHRKYREEHREEKRLYFKEIGRTDERKWHMRIRNLHRRAQSGKATATSVKARIAMWGGHCWICGADYDAVDHVKPLACGGSNWPANLRPICKPCNDRKNKKWHGVEGLDDLVEFVLKRQQAFQLCDSKRHFTVSAPILVED